MVGEFDDDLFHKPKEKTFISSQNYQVKYCCQEWYEDADLCNEYNDRIQILKYRADRAYASGHYTKALTYFRKLSQESHSLSSQMSREVTESIARTHLRLKNAEEALRIAQQLSENSATTDHKTCSWMLLANVYHQMKIYSSEILTYMKLLQLHPFNDRFWILLAEALADHWGISLTGPVIHSNVDRNCNTESFLPCSAKKYASYILGCCFIRARIITQNFHQRLKTNGLPKYSKSREKIDSWLGKLQMAEQFQRHAIQILSKDMSDESEDQCEGESPWQVEDLEASKRNNVDNEVNSDKLQFFYKWFGWIYDHINL